MDGWPRIPHPNGGSGKASPRTTATSLPAPGSTVVAAVEEDLGDGMYSLRWAGQKIHVSSRAPLAKGQAFLLKSETSPEGRPRLVVVGPAPEQAAVTGRVIYGPNIGKRRGPEPPPLRDQPQTAQPPRPRVGGDSIDTGTPGAAGQAGGQMAAGVSRAVAARAPEAAPGLIGLVLEPLPEFEASAKNLLAAAGEEKARLEGGRTKEAAPGSPGSSEAEAEGGEEAGEGLEKSRKEDPARSSAPGRDAPPSRQGYSAQGTQASQTAQGQAPSAQPPSAPAAQTPAAQPPSAPAAPPSPPAPAPQQPAAQHPTVQQPSAPAAQRPAVQQPAAQPPSEQPHIPVPPDQPAAKPAPGTPVFENGGPVVPDVPVDAAPAQPQARPAVPGTPPGRQPAGAPPHAALPEASAAQQPRPAVPAVPPGQPPAGTPAARPGGAAPVTPSTQPAAAAPAQPPSAPEQPVPPAPAAPANPAAPAAPERQPDAPSRAAVPPEQQGSAGSNASVSPSPAGPGQQTAAPTPDRLAPVSPALPPGPSAQQTFSGTVLPEGAGSVVPEVPADGAPAQPRPAVPAAPSGPQTLPGAVAPEDGGQVVPEVPVDGAPAQPQPRPAAPAVPPGQPPAGTAPPAAQPDSAVPATPTPPPSPGTPAPQPPPAPGQAAVPPPEPSSAAPAAPAAPQPAAPGAEHSTVPSGSRAPQPLPGMAAPDSAGPAAPEIPVGSNAPQPQTRPAAPVPAQPELPIPPQTPERPAPQPPGAPNQPPPAPEQARPIQPTPPADTQPGLLPAQPQRETPAPQPPTTPSAGAYPRPGTATYSRPTPRQSLAANADRVSGAAAPDRPPPEIRPEALLKEALGQMIGAAEIPLGNPATDAQRLGAGGRMPEAVLDKAAAILLRGAGLSPDPETTEAAKALVANNAQVDRDSVQALLSATAGIENPEEREAALRAAARLLSKDIPLSPPLVSGMADVVSRRATAHQLMDAAIKSLSPDAQPEPAAQQPARTGATAATTTAAATTAPPPPEAEALMAGARELLDMLHVDLERGDAPEALERYMSTFGREALGRALALVETSAQAVLEASPQLQKIDQALTAILTQLQPEMEQAMPQAQPQQQPPPAQEEIPPQPPPQPQQSAPPPPAHASRPINAYLNAPKALPIEEMLKSLPPMPKVVSLGTPPPEIPHMPLPGRIANMTAAPALPPPTAQQSAAQTLPGILSDVLPDAVPNILPDVLPQAQGQTAQPPQPPRPAPGAETLSASEQAEQPEPPDPEQIFRQAEALRRRSGVLNKLDSLFQIPGLNRRELELLRPGGFLDRFMNSAAERPGHDAAQTGADAEKLLGELLSDNPRTAERARQELPQRESAVLRETAARLTRMESDAVRADPLVNRLSDAATSLRDLGRQLLAVKAENLALQDRNPGVMLAEVPFKLNNDAGDGRMQMFYRRGKKKGGGWSSRVILDLNTTRMGPVLGDMRFFGQDMTLNMFVDKQEAADFLGAAAEELTENLLAKGFRVKMKCMVLPPPPPPPALDGERPEITGEEMRSVQANPPGIRGKPGRLDIEM